MLVENINVGVRRFVNCANHNGVPSLLMHQMALVRNSDIHHGQLLVYVCVVTVILQIGLHDLKDNLLPTCLGIMKYYTLIELRAKLQRRFAKVTWRKNELVARTVCITMGDNRCRYDFLHSY